MAKEPRKSVEDEIMQGLANLEKTRAASTPAGILSVRISDDKLTAFVTVPAPDEAQGSADKSAVITALAKAGVTFGITEKEIDDIFTYGSFNVEVPVAKGKPPSDGTPAIIGLKFETSADNAPKLQEDEHGNVDLKNLNIVTSVDEGALLAVKTPSVPGEKGKTVLGDALAAKDGKDVKLPLGENVKAGDDGLTIYAALSGQPILKDGKVTVSPVFEVRGDVNYKTGNIKFTGSVAIHGNIASDFQVEATDDVTIYGNIEKASILAGGDVVVQGGIYGGGAGKIKAAGSITIRTVESSILDAGENIVIGQSVRHSTISAGNDILLQNAKGTIIGGKSSAGHHFIVSNLGAQSFAETVIEIGMNPRLKKIHDDLEKQIGDHKVQLEKAIRTVKTIKEQETQGLVITPDKQELLKKLVPAAHSIRASLESDQAKLEFLTDKLKSLKAGRCRVNYKTYPGVKFFSLNSSMTVQREINHSSFYEQNEQIIVGPY